jgi:type VI secretion system secreted protein VgrG
VAKTRAERLVCEQRTFSAMSDCVRLRAGHFFEVEETPYSSYSAGSDRHARAGHRSGKYLVTEVEYTVGLRIDEPHAAVDREEHAYVAQITAIAHETQYRPERRTPKPRLQGVMHAHVAADGSGKYAEIDDQGRYKVCLPFDASAARGASTSRWIRMAQPYSGPGYGTHHPLHKGTEVLLMHIDGDPDRPIIVGSVPNPRTVSPSTRANETQSVTQTASGIRFELEDRAQAKEQHGHDAHKERS